MTLLPFITILYQIILKSQLFLRFMTNIQLIKKGDENEFNNLVKQNLTMILNFVYRFCYDTELAEDITQEVFIKI